MANITNPSVLMFAPHCYPPADAESIVTSKLILAAMNDGWQIETISRRDASKFYQHEIESDIIWHAVEKRIIPIMSKYPLMWTVKAFKTGQQLIRSTKINFMFSRVSPIYGHLPALLLSYIYHIPWIAYWSDPMPHIKAPPPFGEGSSATVSFPVKRYLMAVAQKASWHIFPSEELRNYMCSYLPVCKEKSSVIHHIASDLLRLKIKAEPEIFSLCHAGGLGLRSPASFLQGVRQFLDETGAHAHVRLRFVGARDSHLEQLVGILKLGIPVTIEGPKKYIEALESIASSTIAIVIEAPSDGGIFFPSKFADYVQVGRPILAVSPRKSTLSNMLSTYGGGLSSDINSPDDIAAKLKLLYVAWKCKELETEFSTEKLFRVLCNSAILSRYKSIMTNLGK